ncbi:MAG: TraX family protein [Eubacteriales bacterium]|nr:TraX family protein [Eubacteriales bacterium]MDD3866081.1 TraX family protein [Eubacteriales bacterium]MDD4460891.1 TraX family protein [Eubacteriales bacterium]
MLKLLACLFMLIDHIGYYWQPWLPDGLASSMRIVGRLAFPVFAFGIAHGYLRTRNPLIYFIRMSVFAIITEFLLRTTYAWAGLLWSGSNVLVTFALAIVMISGWRLASRSSLDVIGGLRPLPSGNHARDDNPHFHVRLSPGGIEMDRRIALPLGILFILLPMLLAIWLRPDYGLYGLVTVLVFYIVREQTAPERLYRRSLQAFIVVNAVFLPYRIFIEQVPVDWAILQTFSIAAVLICEQIQDSRPPRRWTKYLFYLFYPLHIILLIVIRQSS